MVNITNGGKRIAERTVQREPLTIFEPFEFWKNPRYESLFDYMLRPTFTLPAQAFFAPEINLYEKDGGYVLECALPGLKKEQIRVEIIDNKLMISAKFEESEEEKRARYHYRELQHGSFHRSVSFAEKIDPRMVVAKYEDGLLKVTIPVPKTAIAQRVAIQD